MASGDDIDSGMESSSKATTPVSKIVEDEDDMEDGDDETLSERLWGLTEMFPNPVRNLTWNVLTGTTNGLKFAYSLSRTATWMFFSSSVILFAPVIFEIERTNVEEAHRREQKQVLLGPNAALSGGPLPPR